MMIQTPGSFLLVFSISIQEGTNWTSYLNYIAGGTLQGMLLIMCLVFWYSEVRRSAYQSIEDEESEEDIVV
jgi:hypothetical protein